MVCSDDATVKSRLSLHLQILLEEQYSFFLPSYAPGVGTKFHKGLAPTSTPRAYLVRTCFTRAASLSSIIPIYLRTQIFFRLEGRYDLTQPAFCGYHLAFLSPAAATFGDANKSHSCRRAMMLAWKKTSCS